MTVDTSANTKYKYDAALAENGDIMKKIIALSVLAAFLLLSLASCSRSDFVYRRYDYDLDKYIDVCEYLGIEIKTYDCEVTEDEVNSQILLSRARFADRTESRDRAAERLDLVNIDYTGYMKGELLEQASDKGYELLLGSNSFISGFENGLLGAMPGDTVTLDLVFPEPYASQPELSGKAVVFVVTVNSVYSLDLPDYNDDFVKKNYNFTTTEDFEAEIRRQLAAGEADKLLRYETAQAWKYVVDNTVVSSYPQKEYNELYNDTLSYYRYYADEAGKPLEKYAVDDLTYPDYDTFLATVKTETESWMKEEMIFYTIARNEKITVSPTEYREGALELAKNYGLSSVEAIEQYFDPDEIRSNILYDKVMVFLADKAVKSK